jgi:hypothetical protein
MHRIQLRKNRSKKPARFLSRISISLCLVSLCISGSKTVEQSSAQQPKHDDCSTRASAAAQPAITAAA